VQHIRPVAERAHKADREPIARRFAKARLIFHVVRQMRQRIALRLAPVVRDRFIASRKRNRLKTQEPNLLGLSSAN